MFWFVQPWCIVTKTNAGIQQLAYLAVTETITNAVLSLTMDWPWHSRIIATIIIPNWKWSLTWKVQVVFNSFTEVIPDHKEWLERNERQYEPEWFTDSSKTKSWIGAAIYTDSQADFKTQDYNKFG